MMVSNEGSNARAGAGPPTSWCEEAAFTEMFRTHYRAVRAFAAVSAPAPDVDDVVAETFAVAWRRCRDLPDGWVRGWLLGTARNVVRNSRRRRARADRFVARFGWLQPSSGPGEPVVGAEELEAVRSGLGSLSESDQEVLVLAGWFELSTDELALTLGVSNNTAAVRLHRARQRLRDAVDDGEFGEEVVA